MRRKRGTSVALVLVSGLVGPGCGDLAVPPRAQGQTPSLSVEIAPGEHDGQVPPVVRFKVDGADGREVFLVKGKAGASTMGQLQDGVWSSSLRKRVVECDLWDLGTSWMLAPKVPLRLDTDYSLVVAEASWSRLIHVAARDELPVAERLWPPAGRVGGRSYAVWCLEGGAGGRVREPISVEATLAPDGARGELALGALDGVGRGCVHWESQTTEPVAGFPPLIVDLGNFHARLAPGLLWNEPGQPASRAQAGACPWSDAMAVDGFCLRVLDDRVWVCSREEPRLVSLRWRDVAVAGLVDSSRVVSLRPLPAERSLSLEVAWLEPSGSLRRREVMVRTRAPMAHVVINEVMADSVGPEPCQEWVELYNAGSKSISLEGWKLQDSAASVDLPASTVPSHGYAVVVNDCYDERSWVDKAPAADAVLVRVEHLGKSGLSNSGEPLRLVDRAGQAVSVVPAIRPRKPGWSVARIDPDDPREDVAAFGVGPDGGTPGGPNVGVMPGAQK